MQYVKSKNSGKQITNPDALNTNHECVSGASVKNETDLYFIETNSSSTLGPTELSLLALPKPISIFERLSLYK